MVLFLRDKDNNSVVDLDFNDTGKGSLNLSVLVDIEYYSPLLLAAQDQKKCIEDFTAIQGLRGWLFEVRGMHPEDITPDKYDVILEELRVYLRTMGERYGLFYVED